MKRRVPNSPRKVIDLRPATHRGNFGMGKWIAGIIAAIIGGVAIWALTGFLQKRIDPPPPPPPVDDRVLVSCTPNPPTVAPGATSELTLKVTRGGQPVENAALKMGNEDWGSTLSDGTERVKWKAPAQSAGAYVMRVTATLSDHDGGGGGAGDCQILISG